MKTGHGRGYYGEGQLSQQSARSGGGWFKLALVAGVGSAIWFMWPRRKFEPVNEEPNGSAMPAPLSTGAHAWMTEAYPGQQAYEDAVVASALQLQAAGAKVVLAPHLAHLAPRLGGAENPVVQVTPPVLAR